jgi:DNA-directed RNA polymerase subunit RPC12/RpoP
MESPIATQITCTQCGGELHPDEGQAFLTCPYCSATVYLDKSRVVFHWSVAPTLDERQALSALYRWMSGSQTVKDLDKKAQVTGQAFQYFPVWYFKYQGKDGEQELLRPAAATSITELSRLKLPAGDLQRYNPALDAQAAPPSVPLEAALAWLDDSKQSAVLKEAAVVHVPLYFYKYAFGGKPYTAVVDAASGSVLASLYPPKAEAPYLLVGVVTALVYLCLATFPLFGMAAGDSGMTVSLMLCGGLGIVAAPILFAWAFWVASKV